MARPTPVLPDVGSTSVPPSLSSPDFSADWIIRRAMRSLTDPPGLKYSTLTMTSGPGPARCRSRVTSRNLTSGVLPTVCVRESYTCMLVAIPQMGQGPSAQVAGPSCFSWLCPRRYPNLGPHVQLASDDVGY